MAGEELGGKSCPSIAGSPTFLWNVWFWLKTIWNDSNVYFLEYQSEKVAQRASTKIFWDLEALGCYFADAWRGRNEMYMNQCTWFTWIWFFPDVFRMGPCQSPNGQPKPSRSDHPNAKGNKPAGDHPVSTWCPCLPTYAVDDMDDGRIEFLNGARCDPWNPCQTCWVMNILDKTLCFFKLSWGKCIALW